MEPISIIPNFDLSFATSDVYYTKHGCLFKPDFKLLLDGLQNLQNNLNLSQAYRDFVLHPFINFLIDLDEERFQKIFSSHPEDLETNDRNIHNYLPMVADALLQRGYGRKYYKSAFDDLQAFQAIVNDFHQIAMDKELSVTMPPLVLWSKKRPGPSTLSSKKSYDTFNINIGFICLPPDHRIGGLFAWSVLGHEVAGHEFLQSKPGLIEELKKQVSGQLESSLKQKISNQINDETLNTLSSYWCMRLRIEELASDILGILTTGPSLAIGSIGYLRGADRGKWMGTSGPYEAQKTTQTLVLTKDNQEVLRCKDLSKKISITETEGLFAKDEKDEGEIRFQNSTIVANPHPISVLRPFAMTQIIQNLDLESKNAWISLIEQEVYSKDLQEVESIIIKKINTKVDPPETISIEIPKDIAITSAKAAAEIIATTKLQSLGERSLIEIFSWTDKDECIVELLGNVLKTETDDDPVGASARHVIAAAIIKSSERDSNIEEIFGRMKTLLVKSLSLNPATSSFS